MKVMSASVGHSQMTLTSEPETFRKPPWWNRRTKLERSLLFVTVTSLLMVSVMAVVLAIFGYMHHKNLNGRQTIYLPSNNEKLTSDNSTRKFCLTPGCVKAAAQVLKNMDDTVDPCQDFYQFACGGWMSSRTISEDRSSTTVFSDVQDDLNVKLRFLLDKKLTGKEPSFVVMVKTMYGSCMDLKKIEEVGAKPMIERMKILGGWPVVEGSKWNESAFDWIDMLLKFRQIGYSHDIMMDLSVTADYRDNTVHIIEIDQPTLGMPDRAYFLRGFNDSVTDAYFKLMVKTAIRLGANKEVADKELKKAFDFETVLANLSLPREQRRNISELYNKYTVQELQKMAPQVNWLKYFNGLLTEKITVNESLLVIVPTFVKKLAELVSETDKRTIANYLMWRMVGMSISTLSKDWRSLAMEYSSVLTGKNQEEPRWEHCLSSLTGTLGVALGSFYVRNYFKDDSKDSAMEMVDYIHKEFLNILHEVDWMQEDTRRRAIDKANHIASFIGYPDELMNDTAIAVLYDNLTLTDESYFDNALRIKTWSTNYAFKKLRLPNIKGEWKKHAKAAVVNAYYNSLENSIEFPAGILQNVFFSKDRPHYMNFGAIGFVIGHEITHGFDDRGRQFDKDGNNKNWWDPKTDAQFKEKAQCIIDQYGNYTLPEVGLNVNGINTQGENIADNGGLKEAYYAYHAWARENGIELDLPGLKYNAKQLFWISAASVWCGKYKPEALKLRVLTGAHSPPQFRVMGPLSNLNEFAKDFQCPVGSVMNPEKKCQVW